MKKSAKWIIILHIMLAFYSLGGLFSKLASTHEFMSLWFIIFYGASLFTLVVYAFSWQQIIKRMALTTAYANKAITVLWGIVYGAIFFDETITFKQRIGAVIIVVGVVLFVRADKEVQND